MSTEARDKTEESKRAMEALVRAARMACEHPLCTLRYGDVILEMTKAIVSGECVVDVDWPHSSIACNHRSRGVSTFEHRQIVSKSRERNRHVIHLRPDGCSRPLRVCIALFGVAAEGSNHSEFQQKLKYLLEKKFHHIIAVFDRSVYSEFSVKHEKWPVSPGLSASSLFHDVLPDLHKSVDASVFLSSERDDASVIAILSPSHE
jgi:hypothetical protein